MRQLGLGLHAFCAALQRRREKRDLWVDLARLHARRVVRAALLAWRWDFAPAAAAKRARLLSLAAWRRERQLRHLLAAWIEEAARCVCHGALRTAINFECL